MREGGAVDSAKLVGKYSAASKLMLVHYAVDIKRLPREKRWQERFLPHDCKGLGEMLIQFRAEFQITLALHGHMHIPYLYNHSSVQVVSATTASEREGPNGLFIIKTIDTGEIRAEHHRWNGLRFTADPDTTLTKPLELRPTGAAA